VFRRTDLYDIAGRGLSASEEVGNMMLPIHKVNTLSPHSLSVVWVGCRWGA